MGRGPSSVSSVYVHAPFCLRRCFYCDFAVTLSGTGEGAGWLKALSDELAWLSAEGRVGLAPRLETLYVGGGTPSILGSEAMGGLAHLLGPDRLAHPGLEWTVEANPESFTPEVARGWARAGVNRVSLGAQSFQDDVLRWMGRLHGSMAPERAVEAARAAGITNLSLDLIFGLPQGVERRWEEELDRALDLRVPHLSLYGLTAEKGTPLGAAVARGEIVSAPEGRYREEFLLAHRRLGEAGYRHYEVSNFALPGFQSRHNRVYWEMEPYLGLGNSAHSFLPPLRRWNLRDWGEYEKRVREGDGGVEDGEEITPGQARLEEVWLGLRTDRGVALDGLSPEATALAREWVEKDWAVIRGEMLVLTPGGWLLLDHLAVALDEAMTRDPAPP